MRQNFLSKETFAETTEWQARESLLSIPVFASNIRLIEENKMLQSFKFSYEQPVKKMEYFIDVTILPLNEKYTRISLHGRRPDGHAFNNDADMAMSLHDFESALLAAVDGDTSLYKPYTPKPSGSKKFFQLAFTLVTSASVFILKKKLS